MDSSLPTSADQLNTGGLHQNNGLHRVLLVLHTAQDQFHFIHHVTQYCREGGCRTRDDGSILHTRIHTLSECVCVCVCVCVCLCSCVTFVYDVAYGLYSQCVIQRNRHQRVCVTCQLTDGPLRTHTNALIHVNTHIDESLKTHSVYSPVVKLYH